MSGLEQGRATSVRFRHATRLEVTGRFYKQSVIFCCIHLFNLEGNTSTLSATNPISVHLSLKAFESARLRQRLVKKYLPLNVHQHRR